MSNQNNYCNQIEEPIKDGLKISIIFENQEAAIKALCEKVFGAVLKYKHEIVEELKKDTDDES